MAERKFMAALAAAAFIVLQGCSTPAPMPVPVMPKVSIGNTNPANDWQTQPLTPEEAKQDREDIQLNDLIGLALVNNGINNVSVKSYQGIVQLNGRVASNSEAKSAEKITYGVAGVRFVNNTLIVLSMKHRRLRHHYR